MILPVKTEKKKISANDFYVDLKDMEDLDEKEIIAERMLRRGMPETDEYNIYNEYKI